MVCSLHKNTLTIIATMQHGLNDKKINKMKYIILQHYYYCIMSEVS